MDIVSQKKCAACKIEKSLSEFYPRGKTKYYCSECKECMKARSKRQAPRNRQVSTVESEGDVIKKLLENGVPALPGKALRHQWADVVAWGCILIEVKSSNLINGQFSFGFTSAQRRERLRGEFIALVANWGDHSDYYIFPANLPMFYNKDGTLKTAVGWTPNRKIAGRKSPMTDKERESYRDAWHLIETRRLEIVQQLRQGNDLIEILKAA